MIYSISNILDIYIRILFLLYLKNYVETIANTIKHHKYMRVRMILDFQISICFIQEYHYIAF